MATIATTAHFGLTTRFEVVIDGFSLGGWAKCEGLSVSFDLEKYAPLGNNDYLPILPNRVTYDHIKLTRAVTTEDAPKVMAWLSKMAGSGATGTAEITLFDSHKQKVTSWKLRNVYPTKWQGPTLDAGSHNIATETLELAHEGFLDA
jgi:phage tail-like protein